MIQKFHVKIGVGAKDGGAPHNPGAIITADQLPVPRDMAWLLRSGALVPFGNHSKAESLLSMDSPTPEQFREEVTRLQQIIEDQQSELDGRPAGFKSAATAGTQATAVPIAADNTARKLLESTRREAAEERLRSAARESAMSNRVKELESEVAALTAQLDQLTAPVA